MRGATSWPTQGFVVSESLGLVVTCGAGFGICEGAMQTIPIAGGFKPNHPFTVQSASSHFWANGPFSPVTSPPFQPLTPRLVSNRVAAVAISAFRRTEYFSAPTGQFAVSI